jgi:hypothetical protein
VSDAHKLGETWLVVASTGAALVNLVAAAVTGIEKYDRILFLTGANPIRRGNTRDIEAERGFERLLRALAYEAGLRHRSWRPPEPDELTADMNDPWPWMTEIAEFFGPGGMGKAARHIVYVYTGGTKDMTIGCWDGFAALRNQRPDITIEFVSKQERRVFWPKEPQRTVPLTGGDNHVSIEAYLLASGYEIVNSSECSAREAFASAHAQSLVMLGQTLLGRRDARQQQWSKLLNRLAERASADVEDTARDFELPRVDVPAFCAALGPLVRDLGGEHSDLALSNGRGAFRRGAAVRKQRFHGDWFEDWLFVCAREALKETRAQLMHGLKIVRLDAAAHGRDNEIDLAILANDQLYIAEAKTSLSAEDARPAINRLSALRKQVVGPPRIGKAWLICAELVSDAAARREIAQYQDVEFVAGQDEIESMITKLPEIVN